MPNRLRLLGRPQWGPRTLGADKTYLLLYYLAFRGTWASREEIAFVFWPDAEERRARRNLRQLLYRLRRTDGAERLEVDAHRLRLHVDTDVHDFRDAIGAGRWTEALDHYGGPLLEGVSAHEVPGYEAWLALEREGLRASWREAALHVASALEASDRYGDAAALLKEMWLQDRFDEAMLRAYVRNAYLHGHRDKALQAFAEFEALLRDELGLRPLDATVELAAAVAEGAPLRPEATREGDRVALPAPHTPFLGRESEREDVRLLLGRPDCRMLVIVGPGGVGKTRFAIQAAAEQAERFAHGVCFVPLAHVGPGDAVFGAVADALEFPLFGWRDAEAQVFAYLRDKEMLLVVDNLEHVIEESAVFVELLEAAPRLKILATSRHESRTEQHAWHYPLAGFPYGDSAQAVVESDAGRLFTVAARRASPRFALRAAEAEHLLDLCRLTDGLPLALELAAAWAYRLSVQEIAGEIRSNLGILSPNAGADAGRGSMRAVYEHSWSLLTADEQAVLSGISAFRGGFSAEAAKDVAAATLYALLSLVGKSLLHKDASERYDMHPLVRRYAAEKLAERVDANEVEARHARWYAVYAEHSWRLMEEGREMAWLEQMSYELPNLLAMWAWAVRHRDAGIVGGTVRHLTAYLSVRSRYREGLTLVTAALEAFPERTAVRGKLLARLGNLRLRQEGAREARPLLEEALGILEAGDDTFEIAFAQMNLAGAARAEGDLDEAEWRFRASLARFRELGHRRAVGHSLFNLGLVALERGELSAATDGFEGSLAIVDDVGDLYAGGHARVRLADARLAAGDAAEARRLYEAGLERFGELDHATGRAHALVGLARVALHEAMPDRAEDLLRDADAIYRETGDRMGMAEARIVMGDAAAARGDPHGARAHRLTALGIARETASTPSMLLALAGLMDGADLAVPDLLACAVFVGRHPAATANVRRALEERTASLERRASEDARRAAQRQASSLTLDEVTARLADDGGGVATDA